MEAADACEIERLPEELLSAAICLTTPGDARRAASVSRAFRAAADGDVVWSRFLPRDLPPLADDGQLSRAPPPSNKGRFLRLADRPVILADGRTSMWLDRETDVIMLSARMLGTIRRPTGVGSPSLAPASQRLLNSALSAGWKYEER